VLHRLFAVITYPAHLLNRLFAGPLGRVGLGRLPGALPIGLALAAMAISAGLATASAFEARPRAQPTSVSAIERGDLASGLWVTFDALLVDGPHVASVEVFSGPESTAVPRVYYLVVDPEAPDRGVIVRARGEIDVLPTPGSTAQIDGTITEDAFNLRGLLEGWDLATSYPNLRFGETRAIAFGFSTPWVEPSYVGAATLAFLALIALVGAFVRQPILREAGAGTGPAGRTPISVRVHGSLLTPRGTLRLDGTAAELQWMDVEHIARVRWRYWGAALGDMRTAVETAVRTSGAARDRLVLHGPTGSLLWPVERPEAIRVTVGDAYLGPRCRSAIGIRGDGADVVLTFDEAGERDAALAELRAAGNAGSPEAERPG